MPNQCLKDRASSRAGWKACGSQRLAPSQSWWDPCSGLQCRLWETQGPPCCCRRKGGHCLSFCQTTECAASLLSLPRPHSTHPLSVQCSLESVLQAASDVPCSLPFPPPASPLRCAAPPQPAAQPRVRPAGPRAPQGVSGGAGGAVHAAGAAQRGAQGEAVHAAEGEPHAQTGEGGGRGRWRRKEWEGGGGGRARGPEA